MTLSVIIWNPMLVPESHFLYNSVQISWAWELAKTVFSIQHGYYSISYNNINNAYVLLTYSY